MLQQAKQLRVAEAAHVAGVTEATILRWIDAGELKGEKDGRTRLVTRESVQKKIGARRAVDTRKSRSRAAHERYSATGGDGHAAPGSERHIKMAVLAREILERTLEFRRDAARTIARDKRKEKLNRTERNALAAEIAMHKLTGVMSAYLTEAECRAFDHESDALDQARDEDL